MNRIARMLCLAPLALHSAGAWCDAGAQVSISNFRIELVDLDPNDGIAPSLALDPGSSGVVAQVFYASRFSGYGTDSGASAFGPIGTSATALQGYGFASGGINGDVMGTQGATLDASASTYAQGGASTATANVTFGNASSLVGFTLSPETRIEIVGDSFVAAHSTHTQPVQQASAEFALSVAADGSTAPAGASVDLRAFADLTTAQYQLLTPSIDIVFDNTGSQSLHGPMNVLLATSASANGAVTVAPVPEPEGAVLPLLGLCWLAGCAHGRARPAGRAAA